ncbi:MAG: hypothetical protein JWM60_2496 [Solirubrobacterales bacterium]|nr:hypothetical protein [Solirubrobacterales bacterium]
MVHRVFTEERRRRHAARRCALLGLGLFTAWVLGATLQASVSMAAECPNEAVRLQQEVAIPDCRAYEMVSPPFKEGNFIKQLGGVADDGERLVVASPGAFANTESDPGNVLEGAVYALHRTPAGWATTPLDPSPALYPALRFEGPSADLTAGLWALRRPDQSAAEGDLYVREPDSSFARIGPAVGAARGGGEPAGPSVEILSSVFVAYSGASGDLSHVLLTYSPGVENEGSNSERLLWPGDEGLGFTESLYEYRGRNQTRPGLVGVGEDGKQISVCGTVLGGPGQDMYNAVSRDGGTVYFTALHETLNSVPCAPAGSPKGPEANELYARLADGETLPISEPDANACALCQTATSTPSTALAPAEFQGASENGRQVFFTTTQELLPGHVGNNLYEYNLSGKRAERVTPLATGAQAPEVRGVVRVSEDGTHVYFVAGAVLTGANAEGQTPEAAGDNLYMYERDAANPAGKLRFVAALGPEDEEIWRELDSRPAQATPNGAMLAFDSRGGVDLYDAATEELKKISPEGGGELPRQAFTNGQPTSHTTERALSDDGRYVVFESEGEIEEYDTALTGPHKAMPLGVGNLYGIDGAGRNVFFRSAEQLTRSDTNTEFDIYDARIGGGSLALDEPGPCALPTGCSGTPSASPRFGTPASIVATPGDNLTPLPPANATGKKPAASSPLGRALAKCRKLHPGNRRRKCERSARARFKPKGKAKHDAHHR